MNPFSKQVQGFNARNLLGEFSPSGEGKTLPARDEIGGGAGLSAFVEDCHGLSEFLPPEGEGQDEGEDRPQYFQSFQTFQNLARDFHGRWNERRFSGFMVQIGLEKFSPCSVRKTSSRSGSPE